MPEISRRQLPCASRFAYDKSAFRNPLPATVLPLSASADTRFAFAACSRSRFAPRNTASQICRAEIRLRKARAFQICAPHPRSRNGGRTVPARIAQIDFVQPRAASRSCLAIGHRLHRACRNALFRHIRIRAGSPAPGTPSPPNALDRHVQFRAARWRSRVARESLPAHQETPTSPTATGTRNAPATSLQKLRRAFRPSNFPDAAPAPRCAASQSSRCHQCGRNTCSKVPR